MLSLEDEQRLLWKQQQWLDGRGAVDRWLLDLALLPIKPPPMLSLED
jgi:hypothetical protein